MAHILIMAPSISESFLLRVVLEKSGYTVSVTNCFGKMKHVIQSRVVDLILFDITTLGTDCFQFLRKIPEPLKNRTIVIAPRNSLAPFGLIMQLTRCNGAAGALLKPIEKTSLLQLVENTLAT
jgi:DNA-binding NtrC family response regulator